MVFRFLGNLLLTPEQLELKQATQDYEACRDYRRARLRELRKNLAREILFSHPDAKFLLNTGCEDVAVVSKQSAFFQYGEFADPCFPKLESLPLDATAKDFRSAADAFRKKITRYAGEPFLDPDTWHYKSMHKRYRDSLLVKGYCLYEKDDFSYIGHVTIYIDDKINLKEIASINRSSNFNKGELNEALYRSVVNGWRAGGGISIIRLELIDASGGSLKTRMFFDASQKFTGDAGYAAFARIFTELRDFLAELEGIFSVPWEYE